MVEFGHKLDKKMKAMLRETKENIQGTNSYGMETGTQINGVDQKEERNIQPEKNKETFIQAGTRGGDGQLGWTGLKARQQLVDPAR